MSARLERPRAVVRHPDGLWRCAWCAEDPLYVRYHDTEWGVPSHEDRHLFEMLCLEGAQAGLAWITILRKRESYRKAFDGFDARAIARYSPARIERLLRDPGIVRNRLKIESVVGNARAYLEITAAGSFADLIWGFAPAARRRRRRYLREIPASIPESEALGKELKRRGFNFVGSTIVYAFMQSVGIVDDHLQRCWVAGRRDG